MFIFFIIALPAPAAWLAWRNANSGRGDRRAAFRLAIFAFAFSFLNELTGSHHVPTLTELVVLFNSLRYALTGAFAFWSLYMAFEPQVRRRWPSNLISWSRFLAGRFRDPLVGGHMLLGVALGIVCALVLASVARLPFILSFAPKLPWGGAAPFYSVWFVNAILGAGGGLAYTFVLNLTAMLVRKTWLAASVFVLLMTLILAPGYGSLSWVSIMRPAALLVALAIVLLRFGVLTAVAMLYSRSTLENFPLTTNFSAWYSQTALLGIGTILALAVYGFFTTLASRPRRPSEPETT